MSLKHRAYWEKVVAVNGDNYKVEIASWGPVADFVATIKIKNGNTWSELHNRDMVLALARCIQEFEAEVAKEKKAASE